MNEELYESYQKYVLQLVNNLPKFITELKEENEELFTKDFEDLVEGISWISKYLIASHNQKQVEVLNEILKKINIALSEKNYYLLGDIVEYELLLFLKEELNKN
ncbi:hypothetical protein [Rummeliibacillus suwonensis]|uniref:hypothetical protein n=1 Tax=Rummeliibacillus suwonensis TaxID=1306154 RepID=UPI0011B585C7|nr:hypothetical protein [Rummeliibacillus suwonensis]MBO2534265.1 hypothetical protein [Rummeliibacillus suwonensis]